MNQVVDRVQTKEKDSPSGYGKRGLSALLEHIPQVRRQVPEERDREGLHDDMDGVHRLGPVLGSLGADPGGVRGIFVDETMVNVGRDLRPDLGRLRAVPLRHAGLPRSPRGNPSTPIPSSGGPCINTTRFRSTRTARGDAGMPAGGPAWSAWSTAP